MGTNEPKPPSGRHSMRCPLGNASTLSSRQLSTKWAVARWSFFLLSTQALQSAKGCRTTPPTGTLGSSLCAHSRPPPARRLRQTREDCWQRHARASTAWKRTRSLSTRSRGQRSRVSTLSAQPPCKTCSASSTEHPTNVLTSVASLDDPTHTPWPAETGRRAVARA